MDSRLGFAAFWLALSFLLHGQTNVQANAPVYSYTVLKTYSHDSRAFTQGLVYDIDDTNVMFESTGLYGQSTVRRVNITTGEVLQSVKFTDNSLFGEGITRFPDSQGNIYQLTWTSRKVYLRDSKTFAVLKEFPNPSQEGWGLTNDGESLIMSDGTPTLWFLDPETFTSQRTVQVMNGANPVARLNELEYINGQVWANVWMTNNIVIIDPSNGNVTGVVNLANILQPKTGDVLNGIAYDPMCERLFVTGKLWPKLFQVEIPGIFPPERSAHLNSFCNSHSY